MAKKIIQDVLPPSGKSIRNIPVSRKRKDPAVPIRVKKLKEEEEEEQTPEPEEVEGGLYDEDSEVSTPETAPKTKTKFSKLSLWIGVLVIIGVVVFFISSFFASATVTITPRQQKITFKEVFTAKKDGTPDELTYNLISLNEQSGTQAPATGEEKASIKASGKIQIYNTTNKSQTLIASTRFATDKGLIYRIKEGVVIPAQKTELGKTTPGSVTALVVADKPGDAYNIGLSDFTIPGFKGTVRYSTIYGRSLTDMTGGFVGMVKKVDDASLATAKASLDKKLTDDLLQQATTQTPEGFILYKDAALLTFSTLPQSDVKADSVTVNEKGTLQGIIFNKETLTKAIATKIIPRYKNEPVQILNIKDLQFTPSADMTTPGNSDQITFTLSGDAMVEWVFDADKIKQDLSGQSRQSLNGILSNYPQVEKAEAVIRPFWNRSFPSNPNSITVDKSAI